MTTESQLQKLEQQLDASIRDYMDACAARDPLVTDDSESIERYSYLDGQSDGLAFALAVLRKTSQTAELCLSRERINAAKAVTHR